MTMHMKNEQLLVQTHAQPLHVMVLTSDPLQSWNLLKA